MEQFRSATHLLSFLPLAALAVFTEAFFYARSFKMAFPWQDSLTSLGVGLGHQATGYVNLLLIQGLIGTYDWQHRIFTMPQAWWMTVALFLILDFVYYWYHRAAHEVNAQHTPFTERNDPDCICSIGMDPVHVL